MLRLPCSKEKKIQVNKFLKFPKESKTSTLESRHHPGPGIGHLGQRVIVQSCCHLGELLQVRLATCNSYPFSRPVATVFLCTLDKPLENAESVLVDEFGGHWSDLQFAIVTFTVSFRSAILPHSLRLSVRYPCSKA